MCAVPLSVNECKVHGAIVKLISENLTIVFSIFIPLMIPFV